MKAASSPVGSGEPRLPRQRAGGSRAGPAECWVFVMQTRPFPTSIKEVASVESVQLGLCDTVGLSNLPVIVRGLAIHFGVSHGVLRAFGALLSKARTRWHPPHPYSCGCTVVFPCLLNQRVVLWSSSVSYLTGMATGPDCVGVGSNCSHIRKPPSLQSAAGICLRIFIFLACALKTEKRTLDLWGCRTQERSEELEHRKYIQNAPRSRWSSETSGLKAEHSEN